MEVQAKLAVTGDPATGNCTVDMPSGYTMDTAKIVNATTNRQMVGHGMILDAGGPVVYAIQVFYNSSSAVQAFYTSSGAAAGSLSTVTDTAPITFGNTDVVQLYWTVPISGWKG
jgi:hypothetical protein